MTPEKTPSGDPGKKKERERPGVAQEEIRPWESGARAREHELISQYREGAKIEASQRREIGTFLDETIKGKQIELVKAWLQDPVNRRKMQERGFVGDLSEERQIGIALEMGALADIKEKKFKYQNSLQELEDLEILANDLQNEFPTLETQFLTMDILNRRAAELRQGEGFSPEDPDFQRILKMRVGLADRVFGSNLQQEADEEYVRQHGTSEDYVSDHAEEGSGEAMEARGRSFLVQEWGKLSEQEKGDFLDQDDFLRKQGREMREAMEKVARRFGDADPEELLLFLMSREEGLRDIKDVKVAGIFRKRIKIGGKEIDREQFDQAFKDIRSEVEREGEELLRARWETRKGAFAADMLDARIREMTEPEELEKRIRTMYQEVINRLVADFEEGQLAKESPEVLAEAHASGFDIERIIRDVTDAETGLRNRITGSEEEDSEVLLDFFRDQGISLDDDWVDSVKRKIGEEDYKEAMKSTKGLLGWLFELFCGFAEDVSIGQIKRSKT